MEVLSYKTEDVATILHEDNIHHNLLQTDRVTDPTYVMSAATAWLRRNPGHNLHDLHILFRKLNMRTIIVPTEYNKEKFSLCVPGNHSLELRYQANFFTNPALISRIQITEQDIAKLTQTGFTCSKTFDSSIHDNNPPTLQDLKNKPERDKLKWAACRFCLEVRYVNPDEELRQDLSRWCPEEIEERRVVDTPEEIIIAYAIRDPQTGRHRYASDYGRLIRVAPESGARSEVVIQLFFS
jgi:hypothetical protein